MYDVDDLELRRRGIHVLVASGIVAALTLLVDAEVELGVAVTIPYIGIVALGLWAPWRHFPLVAALATTVLVVLGIPLSRHAGQAPMEMANRALTIGGIWVVGFVLDRYKRVESSLDRKRRQELAMVDALRVSLKEQVDLRRAIDLAAIVAVTDAEGRIVDANDRFRELYGYSREEIRGHDHRLLNSGHHPPEFFADLWGTIQAGKVWRGEILNRDRSGARHWVDMTIVPFLDRGGHPDRYFAISTDVTERKATEEKLREQALLARLGALAAAVAHEVKNPLTGIAGAVEIIGKRLQSDAPERRIVGDILKRIESLDQSLESLLQYARPRALDLAPTEVGALLDETMRFFREDSRWDAIAVEISSDDFTVSCDAGLLREALLNLLLNAAQAMEGKGRVWMAGRGVDGWCEIEVRDEGPGIPAEVRANLFEPFVTTKARGSGLGLAVAKRIAEAHAGSIEAVSEVGVGTTVRIRIPVR